MMTRWLRTMPVLLALGATIAPSAAGAQADQVGTGAVAVAAPIERFSVAGADVTVTGELKGFTLDVTTRTGADGVGYADLTLRSATKAAPPKLALKWSMPSRDVSGMWTPSAGLGKTIQPDWDSSRLVSNIASYAPVATLFGRDERNRFTVAVGDALNRVTIANKLREEDIRIYTTVELFTEAHQPLTEYRTTVRFDPRPVPFYTVLDDVAAWWETLPGYTPAPVPASAREPLDSTWYSYHQNVPYETVLAEADQAQKLGFKVMIVDDGWQTLDGNRGYAFTGDWQPERLTRMKELTDALHARGMKGAIWFSVPFVGNKSKAFARFRGKFLNEWSEQGTNVLDPRYPEVRAYLIETYKRVVGEWGWDGLKLDFIDQFQVNDRTKLTAENGRDYASVNEAVDRLMTDIMTELRRINPDVMIEFRQGYTGPLIRKFGNMLRASDAPNTSILNRQRVTDVRLLARRTPVHADPIVWHPEEDTDVAALQLLDTLFSVPQISMRIDALSPAQLAMMKNYLRYWNANRSTLLDGTFQPQGIYGDYELISAVDRAKRVIGLYDERVVALEAGQPPKIDIVNATRSARVVVDARADLGSYDMTVTDVLGKVIARRRRALTRGVHALDVPAAGIVALVRAGAR